MLSFDDNERQPTGVTLIPVTGCMAEGPFVMPKRRDELVLAVCDAAIDLLSVLFGVEAAELRSPTRARKNTARVRQVGMYALNVGLGMKMGDIALGFSRDRSTVIHACHLIEDMRDDPDFDAIVCRVEAVFSISFQFVPIGKNEPSYASSPDGARS